MDLTKKETALETIYRKDLNLEQLASDHENKPVIVKDNFDAEFMAVYGTLKVGQGNWQGYLSGDRTKYITTLKMQGWYYGGGLSANYSGNPEHFLVMDIFQVDPTRIAELNRPVDRLEGCTQVSDWGYQPAAVPIVLEPGITIWNDSKENVLLDNDMVVIAKAYPVPGARVSESHDYIEDRVNDNKEAFKRHVEETHPDNGQNFINFYNL